MQSQGTVSSHVARLAKQCLGQKYVMLKIASRKSAGTGSSGGPSSGLPCNPQRAWELKTTNDNPNKESNSDARSIAMLRAALLAVFTSAALAARCGLHGTPLEGPDEEPVCAAHPDVTVT